MRTDATGPGMLWEAMPASDFVALASNPAFLGNPRIQTQHFVGAIKWVQTSDSKITASHQMRVAHQKYKDDELKEVAFRGHAYGSAYTRYSNVEGVWKFAGLEPNLRWTEYNYDKIFQSD
jgi:scytalone dehydratase